MYVFGSKACRAFPSIIKAGDEDRDNVSAKYYVAVRASSSKSVLVTRGKRECTARCSLKFRDRRRSGSHNSSQGPRLAWRTCRHELEFEAEAFGWNFEQRGGETCDEKRSAQIHKAGFVISIGWHEQWVYVCWKVDAHVIAAEVTSPFFGVIGTITLSMQCLMGCCKENVCER